MKKVILIVIALIAVAGGFITFRRIKAKELLKTTEETFRKKPGPELIDNLRDIYAQGGDAAKARCKRMLASISVKETDGAWSLTGITETLEADKGSASAVKASEIDDVCLAKVHTVWGEQSSVGVMESPAWAKFVLANFSDNPISVDRGDFILHTDERVFAYTELGKEQKPGFVPKISAGKGLAGACYFPIVDQPPKVLEFTNGSILVRASTTCHDRISNYKRDVGGWPGEDALEKFPVRTAFSKQFISRDETLKCKPADPTDKGEKVAKKDDPGKAESNPEENATKPPAPRRRRRR